jgi:hypothetical protein
MTTVWVQTFRVWCPWQPFEAERLCPNLPELAQEPKTLKVYLRFSSDFPKSFLRPAGYTGEGRRQGEGAVIDGKAHKEEEPDYRSYLLRLWCVEGDKGRVWRASLQSTQTRQQVGFAELEALFEYLRAQTGVEGTPDLGGRASARPEQDPDFGNLGRFPKSMSGKGGADGDSVDPKAVDL